MNRHPSQNKSTGSERNLSINEENSNHDFSSEIYGAIKSTLGPSGMEKFLVKISGENIITNDGATILSKVYTNKIIETSLPQAEIFKNSY